MYIIIIIIIIRYTSLMLLKTNQKFPFFNQFTYIITNRKIIFQSLFLFTTVFYR